ncbi:hypothetical protein DL769_002197 [Monosporascus sp. CRB-8-3]|nr:hypothetical protein DL769_002197 [Monosporascus sp. CRB-8-3]
MTIGVILQTSSFIVPHMISAVSPRVQDRQGNQHGQCSDVADADVQGQQPRPLVVFETSMNIVGYSEQLDQLQCVVRRMLRRLAVPIGFPATEILADLEDKPIGNPENIADRQEIVFSVECERRNATRWRDLLRGRTKAALPIQYVFYPETVNCTLGDLDASYRASATGTPSRSAGGRGSPSHTTAMSRTRGGAPTLPMQGISRPVACSRGVSSPSTSSGQCYSR